MDKIADTEEWRPSSRFNGYFYSSFGRAGRMRVNGTMRILSGCECGRGYRAISAAVGSGKYKREYIHRGVCEAFNGPCPAGMECRHLDGDITNNRPSNLAWGTPAENSHDKIRHGTAPRKEKNGASKLTSSAVEEMRRIRQHTGDPYHSIAKSFGVSTMTAYRAIVGQSWN